MRIYYILPVLILFFCSCVEKVPDYHSFEISLTVVPKDSIPPGKINGTKVVLSNLSKDIQFTGYCNDSGKVDFTGIEPGFYRATATHSFEDMGSANYLNGFGNFDVFDTVLDTVEVILSRTNAFVIKQYYYSGCLTPAGKQYTDDQFIEIHNNTDLVQYADGISILEHESYATEENYWKYMEDDSIVVKMIWTIPGDGEDVPVEPGHSIVIARDGINHQDDSLGNPLSPVNLGDADFEFWVERPTPDDIDAPYVTNMIENLFTFRGSDVVFHTRGGSAIAIAIIPGTMEEKQAFIDSNLIQKLTSSTRYYGKIPNEYVLDAVEVTWDEAHAIYKRFPIELDAGYTYVEAGARSGLCVRRKVAEVIDGRYVYQDTNNSTEDFEKDVIPNPWLNEE